MGPPGRIDRGEREGLTSEEWAGLRQLEAENAQLRMERDLAQTNRGLLGQGAVDAVSRYRCVDAQKAAGFSVVAACRVAGVTRSAFYARAAKDEQGPRTAEYGQAAVVSDRQEAQLGGRSGL